MSGYHGATERYAADRDRVLGRRTTVSIDDPELAAEQLVEAAGGVSLATRHLIAVLGVLARRLR